MNKYKVQFTETVSYAVDVLAQDKAQAEQLAWTKYDDAVKNGMEHYLETENKTDVDVFDVTNTDDPFNP